MKLNKMAAVRKILSANPNASPNEIVSALTKQKMKIAIGVASTYKSVIRAGAKKSTPKAHARKAQASKKPAASKPQAAPSTNGSGSHGLDPSVVEILKAGRSLGWKTVKSIVDLMLETN
jgi:hypothetical protein